MDKSNRNSGEAVVTPIKPPAPYIGGKHVLAKRIVAVLETIPHASYAEPFLGMGGIFFKRGRRPKAEVVNDISGDVVTLFRILQRHYPQFMDCLKFQITSRREFERLARVDPSTLTDLERAARFLYLQRTSFGGKVAGRTFGASRERPGRFDVTKLAPILEDIHERIAGVTIENLPWETFIERYDGPGTLFYLDPPYWGVEGYYGKDVFARADFAAMADRLAGIEGAFVLSINDREEVRTTFEAFPMTEVPVTYFASSGPPKKTGELVITNRPEALAALG